MDFEKTIGRYVGRLYFLLSRVLNGFLKESDAGITADQFRLLTHLWKEDGVPQQQLARSVGRDRANVTRMLDILEQEGIVIRIESKEDRRIRLIYLTKKGESLEAIAAKCARQTLDAATRNFTVKEKEELSRLLLKAVNNLK